MSQKLYVGNLSFNVTEDQLKTLFSQFGEVSSASIVTDTYTGRARGFGFVEMENHEAAISALNEREFEGRTLTVSVARPKSSNGGDGRFHNRDNSNFRGRNHY